MHGNKVRYLENKLSNQRHFHPNNSCSDMLSHNLSKNGNMADITFKNEARPYFGETENCVRGLKLLKNFCMKSY